MTNHMLAYCVTCHANCKHTWNDAHTPPLLACDRCGTCYTPLDSRDKDWYVFLQRERQAQRLSGIAR
jgi:hypothetical protein